MNRVEELLAETSRGAALTQRRTWSFEAWTSTFSGSALADRVLPVLSDLEDTWALDGGISRNAVRDVGRGEPFRILVAAMAWGFGPDGYGPHRVRRMLETPTIDLEAVLAEIMDAAQAGAAPGFTALFSKYRPRVSGLGVSMGSKFLYFAAGGPKACLEAPLVYDTNVHWALTTLPGGLITAPSPTKRVTSLQYAAVVEFMVEHAGRFDLDPDDAEYALFTARTWLRRREREERIAARGENRR